MSDMNNLYVFDLDLPTGLQVLSQFETDIKEGEWVYFNQKENSIEALFKSKIVQEATLSTVGIIQNLNSQFINYFLGRFSEELNSKVKIFKSVNFYDFCSKLNTHLNDGVKIFDLSRTEQWIWLESDGTKDLSPKLKDFIS